MIIYDKDKQILYIPENDDAVILGWDDIYQKGFRDGYREGYDDAYEDNYQSGYTDGYAEGIVACHVDATSITLDVPSVIVGEADAEVVVSPEDADVELIFTSSDPSIATIDENGHITVKEDGEVTFCVEDLRSGLRDCQTVSVEKPYFMVSPLSISAPASGGTYTISITSNYPQEWSINGSSWMTISPSTGTGSGNINVTIQANEDASRSGSIFIMDGSTALGIVPVSQEAGEEPYFNITPAGIIWFEKSGGTINLTIDTNMDIPWRVVAFSDESAHALTASPASGTGYGVVALSVPDVGCDASNLVIPEEDGLAQFQNYLDIYTGSTLYESQRWVLQKTWLAGGIVGAEILNQPDVYPASGGTYTIKVTTPYGPSDYPNAFRFKNLLGTATYSNSSWTTSGFWSHYFTYVVPANTGSAIPSQAAGIEIKANNSPCVTTYDYENYFGESQEGGYIPPIQEVTVQQLIAEGYANVVAPGGEYKAGTYVQILPTCPYLPSQIVNLSDVALNQEEITAGTRNTIVWNQTLPSGWTEQDIVNIYSGQSLNFTPRGEQFWDIKSGTTNFEITYTGDSYVTSDYPWGSYTSQGIFAPRWNQQQQGIYVQNGWLQTPANVVVNFTSSFSSVSQVMFTQMKSTTALTINQQAGTFACHDVTGMFEGDSALVTLNITGAFNYGTWRTQHNVFDGCTALTGIPYSTSWAREHTNNTIYPHADGARGSANAYHMFRGLNSLTYLGPTINMGAMSLSGCTYGGITQRALTDTFFDCPELTDVRIINLNNNDWNFADSSTFTYIPKMSAVSIEYLLNNVEDVTSQGGHSVTFSSLHKNEVSQSAIDAAAAKGWNVVWDGDSPTPTGSTAVAITYYIQENNTTTKITNGSASSFSDATLDGTTPINLKSNYYTGRYTFADAGTHYIEFTPTGNSISTRQFNSCLKITDVTLPEGITTIGVECFSGCKMLTGVTLCNSLTTIGAQAFMNCSAMTEIHLTSGITTIDDEAFMNCSALTGITIPSSVTTLGAEVFEGCSGLTVMEFEGTTPPTPGNALSLGDVSYTFPIYVPASSVSAYQTAYPNYASRITSK